MREEGVQREFQRLTAGLNYGFWPEIELASDHGPRAGYGLVNYDCGSDMPSVAFDTLATARALQAAGFEAQQADALVNAMSQERKDYVTTDKLDAAVSRLEAALASAVNKMLLSQIAIAGALFAALRLFGGA